MKKRVTCLLLLAAMVLLLLPSKAEAIGSRAAEYLKKGDYIVISPAEQWQKGKRVAVTTTPWELTAQHSGTANGNDVQTWRYGVSDKFYIENLEFDGWRSYVRIQCKNFRESDGGRYWDIEGRSKKSGANLHVWSYKKSASQWFYLEQDNDGDPETFYICNKNSGLYLVPENYFQNPRNDCSKNKKHDNSWSEQGCNVVQSNFAFRWRIQVLNRDAAGSEDKYANWMGLLPDDRYLAQINIPGTHDSGTANVEGSWNSSMNVVSCQKYFIQEQLYAGIRSLDIRTAWNDDVRDMVLVHGGKTFVCHTPDHGGNAKNKTLRMTLDTVIAFLKEHPKETVVMTLKVDGDSSIVSQEFVQNILLDYLKNDATKDYFYQWADAPQEHDHNAAEKAIVKMRQEFESPRLGQTRGKIVLLSRIDFGDTFMLDGSGYPGTDHTIEDKQLVCSYTGPNLAKWDDRYDDEIHLAQKITDSNSGTHVYVQDDYECSDTNKVMQVFNTLYQLNGQKFLLDPKSGRRYVVPDQTDFVFNYTSKTTSDTGGATPLGAAKFMNNILYTNPIFTPGTKEAASIARSGIVVMDYVNKQLARRIIDHNDFSSSAGMKNTMVIATPQNSDEMTGDEAAVLAALSEERAYVSGDADAAQAMVQSNRSSNRADIIWPDFAELTYGYVLGEATLHFAQQDTSSRAGRFVFDAPDRLLTVAQSGEQKLWFIPADGLERIEGTVNVTVSRRPLPIKIENYEVEYGDVFSRSDLSVTAGGYLLDSDLAKINETIEKYDLTWVLKYDNGTEIQWPSVPSTLELASGTIGLRSGKQIVPEDEFPNYDADVQLGKWLVKRTVTIDWTYANGSWHPVLGNVLEDDDIEAVIGESGALELTGTRAEYYQIAEGDEVVPEHTPSDSSGPHRQPEQAEAENAADMLPFGDVSHGHWAQEAIRWAWENGYMTGVSDTQFAPERPLSRAMLVTLLWRMADSPAASNDSFGDVVPGSWYAQAVAWAAQNGIATGTAAGVFAPNVSISREQLVTILWRCAGSPQTAGSLTDHTDADAVAPYAMQAMAWAVEQGIVTGVNGKLLPKDSTTRAQAAALLQRFAALDVAL